MKEPPLTQAELDEIVAKTQARLCAIRKDTPQRLARDIKRLRNLQGRNLSKDTREVLRWAAQNIGERMARMAGALSGDFTKELNRPRRTDLERHFIKAHDMLCRENNGALPNYGAVLRKLREMLPEGYLSEIDLYAIRQLRKSNKKLHLPMSGKVGRPRETMTEKGPHKVTVSVTRDMISCTPLWKQFLSKKRLSGRSISGSRNRTNAAN